MFITNSGIAQTAAFTPSKTTICEGECITFADNSTSTVAIANWGWTFGGGATPNVFNGQNPGNVCFPNAGTYSVTLGIVDANGGNDNVSMDITVQVCNNILNAGFEFSDNLCNQNCTTFRDTSSGSPITWQWTYTVNPPDGVATIQNPDSKTTLICFGNGTASTGPYTYNVQLTVTNLAGDVSSVTNSVTVHPLPTVATSFKDTIIELGNSVTIGATSDGTEFLWEPSEFIGVPTDLISFARPNKTTDFVITASDINGCESKDTVTIYVNFIPGIGVPEIFSPNNDGKNDLLAVQGLTLEQMRFRVYNRYGQQVFDTDKQDRGWDGTFKGKPENPGVFVWTLEYKFNTGKKGQLSGNATLVR